MTVEGHSHWHNTLSMRDMLEHHRGVVLARGARVLAVTARRRGHSKRRECHVLLS